MEASITSEEIKNIRSSYGLSQRSFALLLGIGSASIVRYEQGARPSKANANLIRAARYPQFMAERLNKDGELVPRRQREQAEAVVQDSISVGSKRRARKQKKREPVEDVTIETTPIAASPSENTSSEGAQTQKKRDTMKGAQRKISSGKSESSKVKPSETTPEVKDFTWLQEDLNDLAARLMDDIIRCMLHLEDNGEPVDETLGLLLTQISEVKHKIAGPEGNDEAFLEQVKGYLTYQQEFVTNLCNEKQVD